MTIDKSLRSRTRLQRFRSVLNRAERIDVLRDKDVWEEGQSIFGLPKVRVRRAKRRVKVAAVAEAGVAEGAAAEGEAAPAEGQPAEASAKGAVKDKAKAKK